MQTDTTQVASNAPVPAPTATVQEPGKQDQNLATPPQTTKQDTNAVKAVEEAKKEQDPDFAAKFAALSREQKKLYQERQQFKKELDEYKALKEKEALLEKDPLEYLSSKGLTLDKLVSRAVEKDEPPTLESKVTSIEQRIEAYLKEREAEKQQLEQAKVAEQVNAYKSQIKNKLKADLDKYEAINAMEAYDSVYELIEAYYEKTGELMDLDAAADEIEKDLIETAKKFTSLKKLAPPKPQETTKSPEATGTIKPTVSIPNTLTSSAGAEPQPPQENKLLDRDESIRLIAKQLEERLKAKNKTL